MKTFHELLESNSACKEGAEFAASHATAEEAWAACEEKHRLFACWCVRSTPSGGGKTTWYLLTDERSRHAIVVAERFAAGEATHDELAAARDAALAAARDAAWSAAGSAARAARDAAGSAARASAGAAAWSAAWSAARAAARAAQAQALRDIYGFPFAALLADD
jgi:hypothetical protein